MAINMKLKRARLHGEAGKLKMGETPTEQQIIEGYALIGIAV